MDVARCAGTVAASRSSPAIADRTKPLEAHTTPDGPTPRQTLVGPAPLPGESEMMPKPDPDCKRLGRDRFSDDRMVSASMPPTELPSPEVRSPEARSTEPPRRQPPFVAPVHRAQLPDQSNPPSRHPRHPFAKSTAAKRRRLPHRPRTGKPRGPHMRPPHAAPSCANLTTRPRFSPEDPNHAKGRCTARACRGHTACT